MVNSNHHSYIKSSVDSFNLFASVNDVFIGILIGFWNNEIILVPVVSRVEAEKSEKLVFSMSFYLIFPCQFPIFILLIICISKVIGRIFWASSRFGGFGG